MVEVLIAVVVCEIVCDSARNVYMCDKQPRAVLGRHDVTVYIPHVSVYVHHDDDFVQPLLWQQ